jgi:uncharacterized protein
MTKPDHLRTIMAAIEPSTARRGSANAAVLVVGLLACAMAVAQGPSGKEPASQPRRDVAKQSAWADQAKTAAGLVDKMQATTDTKAVSASLAELKRLADRGSAPAAYWYAQITSGGVYATADNVTAERYLRRAATAGYPDAQYALAMMLLAKTESKDAASPGRAEAVGWLRRSAASMPESVYMLALLQARSSNDPEAAEKLLVERAAKAGYAPAQYQLAADLLKAAPDPDRDREALELLARAAGQGHTLAAYDLGIVLLDGKRAERDAPRAVALLTQAANAGNARAQYALGRTYSFGDGVPIDRERGLTWIQRAAVKQLPEAQYAMGFASTEGIGTPVDEVEAMRWFRRAAERGYPQALFAIGTAYANGYGVPKDVAVAYQWYCKAAKVGHASALEMVGRAPPGTCDVAAGKRG